MSMQRRSALRRVPNRGGGGLRFRAIIGLLALVGLAACSVNRETADITPGADLSKLKSFYVVKFDPDDRGINTLIANELAAMGYTATTGPESGTPKDVDAIVTYRDKWMWDMSMYMLQLNLTLRNARSGYPMAVANSYHTSLSRRSPEEMVREVLTNVFNKAKGGTG